MPKTVADVLVMLRALGVGYVTPASWTADGVTVPMIVAHPCPGGVPAMSAPTCPDTHTRPLTAGSIAAAK